MIQTTLAVSLIVGTSPMNLPPLGQDGPPRPPTFGCAARGRATIRVVAIDAYTCQGACAGWHGQARRVRRQYTLATNFHCSGTGYRPPMTLTACHASL